MSLQSATQEIQARPARRVARVASGGASAVRKVGYVVVSLVAGIAVWQSAAWYFGSGLVSSPSVTLQAAVDLTRDGTLPEACLVSLRRILQGWAAGIVVGVPLGILMGRVRAIRTLLDPYIEFFRFIPPIAFVTVAIAWFGIGETSKVVLIFYTSVFIITINTIAGVLSINESKLRAAASLGAGRRQTLVSVVLPSTVPHIVTGARLALGNSFLTIVSAEIVAAKTGLGSLIWSSRNYGRIDWIFVGIIALGILGYLCDRAIRLAARTTLRHYGVKV